MFEITLLGFLMSGAVLWFFRSYLWDQSATGVKPADLSSSANPVLFRHSIAENGCYQLDTPSKAGILRSFAMLNWANDGLELRDLQTGQCYFFPFSAIRWLHVPEVSADEVQQLTLHLEIASRWRILCLLMSQADLAYLMQIVSRFVSQELIYYGECRPVGPIASRIAGQNLRGEWSLGEGVQLYLLAHWLIVLKEDDRTHGKIDLRRVQRVLAVERLDQSRVAQGWDWLWKRPQSGIVRLQSRRELALFALPQYKEFAREIAFAAGCSLESLERHRKKRRL